MLKVLINSYACCPNMGSEPGMGWNWITSLAKTGEVELYVISEGEFRTQIENFLRSEKTEGVNSKLWTERIHFYWNPVPQSTRDKCWNQGNWSFYPLYENWQKKTAEIAREIIMRLEVSGERIDILHQLNMIGFREPGYLADVSKETGIPLVWGPIGGLKMFPMEYAQGFKMKAFNLLKNSITKWQIKHSSRVIKTLKQSNVLISSIPDSYNAIRKYHGLNSIVIPETGCFPSNIISESESRFYADTLTVVWVGKFDFRKRLDIAIKSISMLKDKDVILKVYGTGNEKQIAETNELVDFLNIQNKVQFMGACPHEEVTKVMLDADIFFFTSVNEDTSTVVLEAVSNGLPVVCFDCCGMAAVIDDRVGRKVPLTNPEQSVMDFANVITELYDNRSKLAEMSKNCSNRAEELSWDNKAMRMVEVYKGVEVR